MIANALRGKNKRAYTEEDFMQKEKKETTPQQLKSKLMRVVNSIKARDKWINRDS